MLQLEVSSDEENIKRKGLYENKLPFEETKYTNIKLLR